MPMGLNTLTFNLAILYKYYTKNAYKVGNNVKQLWMIYYYLLHQINHI